MYLYASRRSGVEIGVGGKPLRRRTGLTGGGGLSGTMLGRKMFGSAFMLMIDAEKPNSHQGHQTDTLTSEKPLLFKSKLSNHTT